ncbi:MAG: hypothetical protein K2X48_18160 [Chitinophagaceae bacterium]|nr:hypothetical protein [Chitinophagaceae bacterium]
MNSFLTELKNRNEMLYWAGWLFIAGAVICVALIFTSDKQVLGINARYKPVKFFLSSAILMWTMGWILVYLQEEQKVNVYSWVVILVLAFELIYIVWQAAKGELSHFNISSPFKSMMFSLMGIAISIMTAWTGYIAFLIFQKSFPTLPDAYVWGIRLGLVLFVIFAFAGGIMAAKLSHNVGGEMTASEGLPILNWSKQFGDLRVPHFLGMHALQILPLIGFYISKTKSSIIIIAVVYFILVTASLVQALNGKPLIKS